jgi:hypothetical protein
VNVVAILYRWRNKKVLLKRYVYRQTTLHQIAKLVIPTNEELLLKKPTQYKKHITDKTVRVIQTPDRKAYWVKDNKFYCADVLDGEFNPDLGKEIKTDSLSKKEMNKLLFILDSLNKGKEDDSRSSGN